MRVAVNGWSLSHHAHTGTGRYVQALLEHLPQVAPEHEIWVVAPGGGPLPSLPEAIKVQRVASGGGDLAKVDFEQRKFPAACRALKADLAHVPHWGPPLSSPVPLVVTVHDVIPLVLPGYRGGWKVRLYTALVTAATRGAALVLTDSDASRRDILRLIGLPEDRVRTVYLAAGPEYTPTQTDWRDDEARRAKYQLPEAYVLYLGGFDRRKNVDALLSAWTWTGSAVGQSYPLVLAGAVPKPDGRLFDDLHAMVSRLDIADSVHFAGPIDEADKPAVYRGAGAFVYPSAYEGFGLPPLEAMASGVPVVTTNNGSIGEVVGDAAFLIDPADTRKFGAGIITVLVEPSVADHLKVRGLERARQFTWEKTARQTAAAYEAAVR
jgi:glycosyltransferase involved in cell wall biosynthesis